jgi:hypothetical protein
MPEVRKEIGDLLKQLEQQRDELRLKLSLAGMETRDEWERLEKKWRHLRDNAPPVRTELGTAAEGVFASLRKAAEELHDGYVRLRKRL